MLAYIVSIYYWTFVLSSSLLLFPLAALIWVLSMPFDRRRLILHRYTCFWASLYTWLNPYWRVKIENRDLVKPGEVYIITPNHQSLVDILVLFRLFLHFKYISKIELFRIPIIGWNMRMNQYIQLARGGIKSIISMMKNCMKALHEGNSLIIFPEGTRSEDGEIQEFRDGAFELALKTKKTILPLAIYGSSQALPKKGVILRGKTLIRVRILQPIPHEEYKDMDAEALTLAVREKIVQAVKEMASA